MSQEKGKQAIISTGRIVYAVGYLWSWFTFEEIKEKISTFRYPKSSFKISREDDYIVEFSNLPENEKSSIPKENMANIKKKTQEKPWASETGRDQIRPHDKTRRPADGVMNTSQPSYYSSFLSRFTNGHLNREIAGRQDKAQASYESGQPISVNTSFTLGSTQFSSGNAKNISDEKENNNSIDSQSIESDKTQIKINDSWSIKLSISDGGLVRIDFSPAKATKELNDHSYYHFLEAFKEHFRLIDVSINVGAIESFPLGIELIAFEEPESVSTNQLLAASTFYPKSGKALDLIYERSDILKLVTHDKNLKESYGMDEGELAVYCADEIAVLMKRFVLTRGIEGYSRRVLHIEHAMDRHLPLVERLHSIQRRVDHPYKQVKRWWYQVREKTSLLFQTLVDSMNDLALEMEQNTRLIHRKFDDVLSEGKAPFSEFMRAYPYSATGCKSIVMHLKSGGALRDKIEEYRKRLDAKLLDTRELLNRVTSMVDSTEQRATNRALNRLQAWGAAFASMAILIGVISQFATSDVQLLTLRLLNSWPVITLFTAIAATLLVYSASLFIRSFKLGWIECYGITGFSLVGLGVLAMLWGRVFQYIDAIGIIPISAHKTQDVNGAWPFLASIAGMLILLGWYLGLRAFALSSWRAGKLGHDQANAHLNALFKHEGIALDVFEKVSAGHFLERDSGKLKRAWEDAAKCMDMKGEVTTTRTTSRLHIQLNNLRDEVLLARVTSQMVLRLPDRLDMFRYGNGNPKVCDISICDDVMFKIPHILNLENTDSGNNLERSERFAYLPVYTMYEYSEQTSGSCWSCWSKINNLLEKMLKSSGEASEAIWHEINKSDTWNERLKMAKKQFAPYLPSDQIELLMVRYVRKYRNLTWIKRVSWGKPPIITESSR